MERWVPYEKLSKKKQRELNAKKRGSWHGIHPVTRKTKNLKAYDRKRHARRIDDPAAVSFFDSFRFFEKNSTCAPCVRILKCSLSASGARGGGHRRFNCRWMQGKL